jgi:heavy metal sensor kinase
MKWHSVRVRLTLWNVGVLALVLGVLGITLAYTTRASLAASVDRALADRGHEIASRWMGRPMFPPRAGPFGAFPAPPRSAGEPSRGSPAYFRRARFLDLEGRSIFPAPPGEDPLEAWDHDTFLVASLAGKELYSTVSFDGEPVRVFSVPLIRDDEIEGVVQVAHSMADQKRLLDGLTFTLLLLIPVALVTAGVGGLFLTDRALRPVREITQTAAQISAEDLSRRLKVAGGDEFAELGATFNGMIGRLEEAFNRLETAYEQQRRFVGDASHELRTPLTTIKANTSLALVGEPTPEEYREALLAADEAADTMNRIVQDLLLLARSDGGQLGLQMRPTPLDTVLERCAATFRRPETARITLDLPREPLVAHADGHHLTRLFNNLLENAVRHTPPEGEITLSARRSRPQTLEVSVRDTGEGIAPEHLPHVCDRFYRVDAARARAGYSAGTGTGLGLAICRSIVQAHGGELHIESELGRGTTVTVTLPEARDGSPSPTPAGVSALEERRPLAGARKAGA